MPVPVDFGQEDILRSTVVQPSWYRLRIGEFSEQLTKDGNSTNYVFKDCIILRDADTGDEAFAGVPIKLLFSAKKEARGFIIGFAEALGFEVKAGSRFDISAASGKEIDAFVENNMWEGRLSNRVNHKYRKPRS